MNRLDFAIIFIALLCCVFLGLLSFVSPNALFGLHESKEMVSLEQNTLSTPYLANPNALDSQEATLSIVRVSDENI